MRLDSYQVVSGSGTKKIEEGGSGGGPGSGSGSGGGMSRSSSVSPSASLEEAEALHTPGRDGEEDEEDGEVERDPDM